jgi:5'-nucleotidase
VIVSMCIALLAGGASAQGASLAPDAAANAPHRLLRVLVTNDDGVGAPGIDAVVEALRRLRGIVVSVVAPATNQSGTGDRFSTTPITANAATTVHGYPATAVHGFPADSVFLAVKSLLRPRPDLVVSGINQGQNIGELVDISGTVGAARTALRLGIPAIAVSQGLASTIDYTYAAKLTSDLVRDWRDDILTFHRAHKRVLNLNVPTCASVRGVKVVPVGRSTRVTSYEETSAGTFQPAIEQRSLFNVDCASTQQRAKDDIDAFTHGFAAISYVDAT